MEFGDLLIWFLGAVGTLVKWGFQILFALTGIVLLIGVFVGPCRAYFGKSDAAPDTPPADDKGLRVRRTLNSFFLWLIGLAVWYALFRITDPADMF